jgi:hypothetical protein
VQGVPQPGEAIRGAEGEFIGDQLGRSAQRDGHCDVFGAGPQSACLTTAINDWFQLHTLAYVQSSDALGAYILCPTTVSRSTPSVWTSSGIFPAVCQSDCSAVL